MRYQALCAKVPPAHLTNSQEKTSGWRKGGMNGKIVAIVAEHIRRRTEIKLEGKPPGEGSVKAGEVEILFLCFNAVTLHSCLPVLA